MSTLTTDVRLAHLLVIAMSSTQFCVVCAEEKSGDSFPIYTVAPGCDHATNTCLTCVAKCIEAELARRVFSSDMITCPECAAPMSRDAVQRYATPEVFERYVAEQSLENRY